MKRKLSIYRATCISYTAVFHTSQSSANKVQCDTLIKEVSGNAEKIIIDTDAGSNDAIAILMLLRAESLKLPNRPHYEVIGITCTYGNTEEDTVQINVLKTLTIANRSDIPVYGGAKKPLVGNFSSDGYFGKDAFGDAKFNQKILGEIDRSMYAATALVELTKKYEGDISVVVLGPVTNVAIATSLDTSFIRRVKNFYMVGTYIAGMGLNKPGVDFNVGLDAESAFILLNSTTSSQLTLLPGETPDNAKIPKEWRRNILGKYNSPYISFINIHRAYISVARSEKFYAPADAVTVATILWPEIITNTLDTNVQVVFDGAAKGSVLVDYKPNRKLRPFNAKIILSVDSYLVKESLIYYLTCEKVVC